MIELIAAAVSGAVAGGGVVWWQDRYWYKSAKNWRDIAGDTLDSLDLSVTALTALRSNCFIPDERGVKVRYSQASLARRVKAETPKEVV